MRNPSLVLVAVVALAACRSGTNGEQSGTAAASASASVASSAAPVVSVAPVASAAASTSSSTTVASAAASEVIPVDEPPRAPKKPAPGAIAAGKATKLADVGLTIAPPFAYTLEDRKTHWNLEDATGVVSSLWVMRKMFSTESPLGEVLPCANPSEGAAHAEPDGSYTYRCRSRASGDGTWFARLIPTTHATHKTVLCEGSSRSSATLKLIETTCRSIKKG